MSSRLGPSSLSIRIKIKIVGEASNQRRNHRIGLSDVFGIII